MVADTTYYDMLYVIRTVPDTVYLPSSRSTVTAEPASLASARKEESQFPVGRTDLYERSYSLPEFTTQLTHPSGTFLRRLR